MRIPASEIFLSQPPRPLPIEQAAVRSVAYADVFDYPLQAAEVHRNLHGVTATLEATTAALASCSTPGNVLSVRDGYYTLPGRAELVDVRRRRAGLARQLWPTARAYGRLIAGLPFVRMVAVTGSLAWDNVDVGADIDYMIVTEPDRLWVCRWLIAALARMARRRGVSICPNYIVSRRALVLPERNLYGAYEITRMVPIAGLGMHRRLRRANSWALTYLPNAVEAARPPVRLVEQAAPRPVLARLARLGEKALRSPLGTVLERYEMRYRIGKRTQEGVEQGEASYGVDWYREHTSGHRQRALDGFANRVRDLGAQAS